MGRLKIFRRSNIKVQSRRRKIKFFKRSLLVLLILGTLGIGLRDLSLRLDSLQLKSIVVEGAYGVLRPDKVIQKAELQVGIPIFSVALRDIVDRLQSDPWIDHVKVSRRLPHTLVIQVRPHEPKLILSVGEFYYLSKQGKVFKELNQRSDTRDLPYLTGLSRQEIEQDPPRAREIFLQALQLLIGYENQAIGQRLGLSEIHYDSWMGFSLYPEKERLRIMVGFDDFEAKLKKLELAFEKLKQMNRSFVAMDLNYEGKVVLNL